MKSKEECNRILERALKVATDGVDGAEVGLGGGTVANARFEKGELIEFFEAHSDWITFRLGRGANTAWVASCDCSDAGMVFSSASARALSTQ